MYDAPPRIWALVKVPALLTLIVTIVRLAGELMGLNQTFFNAGAPGDESSTSVIAIVWLIPVFGLVFGNRLRRGDRRPERMGKAFGLILLAIVFIIGAIAGLIFFDLFDFPEPGEVKEPRGIGYVFAAYAVGTVIAFLAWGRLATALLVYALLARLPVVAITWIAVDNDWQTHHTKLPVGVPSQTGSDLFFALAMPQMIFWIPFTVILGGLFGCLGGAMGGRGKH